MRLTRKKHKSPRASFWERAGAGGLCFSLRPVSRSLRPLSHGFDKRLRRLRSGSLRNPRIASIGHRPGTCEPLLDPFVAVKTAENFVQQFPYPGTHCRGCHSAPRFHQSLRHQRFPIFAEGSSPQSTSNWILLIRI